MISVCVTSIVRLTYLKQFAAEDPTCKFYFSISLLLASTPFLLFLEPVGVPLLIISQGPKSMRRSGPSSSLPRPLSAPAFLSSSHLSAPKLLPSQAPSTRVTAARNRVPGDLRSPSASKESGLEVTESHLPSLGWGIRSCRFPKSK